MLVGRVIVTGMLVIMIATAITAGVLSYNDTRIIGFPIAFGALAGLGLATIGLVWA